MLAASIFLGLATPVNASAAAPPDQELDTYLSIAQLTMQYDIEGVIVPTKVVSGGSFISMPMLFKRTAVLLEDVRLKGDIGGGVFLAAGTPGYFAGKFGRAGDSGQTWCFVRDVQGKAGDVKCIRETNMSVGQWVVMNGPSHKFLPISFDGPDGLALKSAPRIEEKPVKVHPDLRTECRFKKWGKKAADVECLLDGQHPLAKGVYQQLQRKPDGSAQMLTPYGMIRLTQTGKDMKSAMVELIKPPARL
jgi:hypothetical protein